MTEKTLERLTLLMVKVDFDKSVAAQERSYQELKEEYDKACQQLCGKLDDKRLELFRKVMDLRGQIEYEHNLHYLGQGILRGMSLADNIEISGKPLTFS